MRHLNSFLLALLVIPMAIVSVNAQELSAPAGGTMYVSITRNDDLSGSVLDLETLKVETEFGVVAIPMAKIDGIKMHADAKDNAVIALSLIHI